MTLAEIHGKLKPHENMEDLLTSDVFGTFKYCTPNIGLIPFLKQAISFSNFTQKPDFLNNVKCADYFFWPRTANREPDLIIITTNHDNSLLALNIECKYYSAKHNKDNEDILEIGTLSGDQLISQYQELHLSRFNRKELNKLLKTIPPENKFLFFVTAHYLPPAQEMHDTIKEAKAISCEKFIDNFYWISWNQALNLNPAHSLLISDLIKLLIRKKLTPLSAWTWEVKPVVASSFKVWSKKTFWKISPITVDPERFSFWKFKTGESL